MLKSISKKKTRVANGHYAIVASQYNARYVNAMLQAAKKALATGGAAKIRVVRVPGAYEIPVIAERLARTRPDLSAIICLGVILRGETTHAQHIGEAVSAALMQIQIQHEIPLIHEVLLLENEAQAQVRCLRKQHNRGTEAAHTAMAMAATMMRLGTSGHAVE